MTLKDEIIKTIKKEFPHAELAVHERRATILEIRATVEKGIFIEIYANFLTNKRSYSLIHGSDRVFGYDNYRFWHYHPAENPNTHISCKEPSISFAIQQIRKVIENRRESEGEK